MTKTAYDLSDWLGYLKHDEIDLLKTAADLLPPYPTIVNIGAGAGTSSLAVSETRPDANIYTVDIHERGPLGSLEGERNAFRAAERKHPTQILGDSAVVCKSWAATRKIDMLIIDGDHTERGVAADIDGWLPFVKPGGYLVFHDYGSNNWPAVKQVVDARLSHLLYAERAGNLLVLCNQIDWQVHE